MDSVTLGGELYSAVNEFNESNIDPANLEQRRRDYWNFVAAKIIEHIKLNAVVTVGGTGLFVGQTPVTGQTQNVTIQ